MPAFIFRHGYANVTEDWYILFRENMEKEIFYKKPVVPTLIDKTVDAGTHPVEWNGMNHASVFIYTN